MEPGTIVYGSTASNGGGISGSAKSFFYDSGRGNTKNQESHYNGKVVILVDASTLSQAEYTAMALSTTPGSMVIGSRTAGADGNVSTINLRGGINTMISGIGIYYPDGRDSFAIFLVSRQ